MNEKLLKLTPQRYLCPYCGEWHEWEGNSLDWYDTPSYTAEFSCPSCPGRRSIGKYAIYILDGYCNYEVESVCSSSQSIKGKIPISSIQESLEYPIVTFNVNFTAERDIGRSRYSDCSGCTFSGYCNSQKLGEQGDGRNIEITLGFEFKQSDYVKFATISILARKERELKKRETNLQKKEQSLQKREMDLQNHEQSLQERENVLSSKEQELAEQQKIKEDAIMATSKKTSLKTQLYEKSPKENLEIVKAWAEKYKPVLKWAIPVAAVYGAYRILNSNEFDLSVNNISDTCEKQLGFKVEFLENKRTLKELMAIGGLCAGAYGAVQAISGIFGAKEEKDVSVEEVEAGMSQLESISKKFAWIQPKTEDMLPIALSVILVYVTLHKPKFTGKLTNKVRDLTEDFQVKLDTYIELAKLFIQEKFGIDFSNKEEQKKLKICAFLVAVMGIFAFLYGKKVLGGKASTEEAGKAKEETVNKSVEAFIEQAKAIVEKIAPTVYTTLITLLVSKKILMLEEPLDLSEGKKEPEAKEEADEDGITPEEPAAEAKADESGITPEESAEE